MKVAPCGHFFYVGLAGLLQGVQRSKFNAKLVFVYRWRLGGRFLGLRCDVIYRLTSRELIESHIQLNGGFVNKIKYPDCGM